MLTTLVRKVVGSRNDRTIKRMHKQVAAINGWEPRLQVLSDSELQAKTAEFKQRLQQGVSLDTLLPEVFAVVREVSQRTLGMRHFDVQLVGGMVLHEGKIAEMATGEGKTLVATLPAYLNALTAKGVHIVTVNDYLAKRDAQWMAPVYEFLGLTVGVVVSEMMPTEKRAAYRADIIYGTNNEFGFDYLRDNMAFSLADKVQRNLHFAIIDEVDSILVDEARTPLIISGAAEESSELYIKVNEIIPLLKQQKNLEGKNLEGEIAGDDKESGDYYLDEKSRQAYLTESGHQRVEDYLAQHGLLKDNESLYDTANIMLMHHLNAALRAHALFQKDVDYIVRNNEIIIVDEHTGRTMIGRRWSDGLHQAIEAKEQVKIQSENQTLAAITFQNYFRLYDKLAGMTGTADTEAYEFQQIYGLEVVVIPTNKPIQRQDETDIVYMTMEEKYDAILKDIQRVHAKGQPILVGTASIESSEIISKLLTKAKLAHEILNAKQHEREAHIIVQAGRPGAITIATNMAGRGTDIVLGGNLKAELIALGDDATDAERAQCQQAWQQRHDEVITAGGLYVLGTERHESRRIDNQLRGRAGRQGDPGASRFYLSLQDNLLRIFAAERVSGMWQKLGMKTGDSIEHAWINRMIESSQRKVEGYNFDIRKELLEYDNVANEQRHLIYQQRNELMATDDVSTTVAAMFDEVIDEIITHHIPAQSFEEQWDVPALEQHLQQELGVQLDIQMWLGQDEQLHEDSLKARISDEIITHYKNKEQKVGVEVMRSVEKSIVLQCLDSTWKEHLAAMDYLRKGIHLRGYAQKNPKQEYKRESYHMFTHMLRHLRHQVVAVLSKVDIEVPQDAAFLEAQRQQKADFSAANFQHANITSLGQMASAPTMPQSSPAVLEQESETSKGVTFKRDTIKIGRNSPCHCGSGKKHKQCCGRTKS